MRTVKLLRRSTSQARKLSNQTHRDIVSDNGRARFFFPVASV